MRRKSVWLSLCLVALLLGFGALGIALLRYEPAYYRAGNLPAGESRAKLSKDFYNDVSGLANDVTEALTDRPWQWPFTADQVNSYFSEDFLRSGLPESALPKGLREPRVGFEKDRLRLGFRYGSGLWSTVVTIDLRVWLVPKEPNVVALELQGMRAGALPFSAQSLLERISEGIRQYPIDISPWYRHHGNPVALLRLRSEKVTAAARLTQLELRSGALVIGGRAPQAVAARTGTAP